MYGSSGRRFGGISNGNYWADYAYHLAPISSSHIDEMESPLIDHGVCSFKIFMFWGGYGGSVRQADLENFRPTPAAEQLRQQKRQDYIRRVMRIVEVEIDEIEGKRDNETFDSALQDLLAPD